MEVPVQISFHQMDHSDALEMDIRDRINDLERMFNHIISCRVNVEPYFRRPNQQAVYNVVIEMRVPGKDIVVGRAHNLKKHEDAFLAVRDAFQVAKRRLEEHARLHFNPKQRHREQPPHGLVKQVFLGEGFGFLVTHDNREIYFHENSVVEGKFDELEPGMEVRFHEEMGEQGPQASSVFVVGKQNRFAV